MRHHGQRIAIEDLPASHRQMRGLYAGETDSGCPFQIYVYSGTRQASGNEMMKAHIHAMSRGRPMLPSDMRVSHEEVYVIVGNHHRKDIRINPNGSYSHGSLHGRTFREIVESMIETSGPRPKPAPAPTSTPGP